MARRGKKKEKGSQALGPLRGTMTAYCYFEEPREMKTLFKLRGITVHEYHKLIEDWKGWFIRIGQLHLWAGSSLLIYPDQHDQEDQCQH